jgi:8-oxo-dGTP pyrophosphatase MutT (NUDIX family)
MARDLFPVVVHTLVLRGDAVLLLRRAGTGYGDGLLQPPGGHQCAGESITEAALRECREEACIEIDPADLRPLCVMPYGSPGGQGIDFLMLAERFRGEPRVGEPHKADAIDWYPLAALPERAVPFLAPALDCWRAGRWFHEFGFPVQ